MKRNLYPYQQRQWKLSSPHFEEGKYNALALMRPIATWRDIENETDKDALFSMKEPWCVWDHGRSVFITIEADELEAESEPNARFSLQAEDCIKELDSDTKVLLHNHKELFRRGVAEWKTEMLGRRRARRAMDAKNAKQMAEYRDGWEQYIHVIFAYLFVAFVASPYVGLPLWALYNSLAKFYSW